MSHSGPPATQITHISELILRVINDVYFLQIFRWNHSKYLVLNIFFIVQFSVLYSLSYGPYAPIPLLTPNFPRCFPPPPISLYFVPSFIIHNSLSFLSFFLCTTVDTQKKHHTVFRRLSTEVLATII